MTKPSTLAACVVAVVAAGCAQLRMLDRQGQSMDSDLTYVLAQRNGDG